MKEAVEIWATYPEPLHKVADGTLSVGAGYLPELVAGRDIYTPSSLPACWMLIPPKGDMCGPLLYAWRVIEATRERLATAEQEAEEDAKERERRAIENALTREIDEGRE